MNRRRSHPVLAGILLLATALSAGAALAQTGPRPSLLVANEVVWPTTGGVTRAGGNGLIIDEGVASVGESSQYGLSALNVDEAGVIRFTYADAWTLAEPAPNACDFTFRRVERELTQAAANDLAKSLSALELQRLKEARPELTTIGAQTTSGQIVRQYVDRFTFTDALGDATGLTKTWLFVLGGRPYYVNKTCIVRGAPEALTVIDQLIGLDYHRDPTS